MIQSLNREFVELLRHAVKPHARLFGPDQNPSRSFPQTAEKSVFRPENASLKTSDPLYFVSAV